LGDYLKASLHVPRKIHNTLKFRALDVTGLRETSAGIASRANIIPDFRYATERRAFNVNACSRSRIFTDRLKDSD